MCLQGGMAMERPLFEVADDAKKIQGAIPHKVKVLLMAHTSCQKALECARMVGGDHLHIVSGWCPAVLATCSQGMQKWAPHISVTLFAAQG